MVVVSTFKVSVYFQWCNRSTICSFAHFTYISKKFEISQSIEEIKHHIISDQMGEKRHFIPLHKLCISDFRFLFPQLTTIKVYRVKVLNEGGPLKASYPFEMFSRLHTHLYPLPSNDTFADSKGRLKETFTCTNKKSSFCSLLSKAATLQPSEKCFFSQTSRF